MPFGGTAVEYSNKRDTLTLSELPPHKMEILVRFDILLVYEISSFKTKIKRISPKKTKRWGTKRTCLQFHRGDKSCKVVAFWYGRDLYMCPITEVGRRLCNLRRPTLRLLSFVLFLLTFTFFLVPLVFIFILRETCQRRKEYIQTMYVSSTLRHAYTIENLRSFFFFLLK